MSLFEIVRRESQPFVAIKVTVSMDELGAVVPPLNGEVFAWLSQRGMTPVGPPFWKYEVINMPGALTIEAGVATEKLAEPDDRVRSGELPAGAYLQTTVHGHPDSLLQATADLLAYAEVEHLHFDVADGPDGQIWAARLEFYLSDPAEQPDLNEWDTLLAFKLAD